MNTPSKDPFKITTKRERALFGLALNEMATPKPSNLVKEIAFLFRGISRIDLSTRKCFEAAKKAIRDGDPSLSDDEVIDRVCESKKFGARLLSDRSRKSVYYQCIILQVSKWMKAVMKKSHEAIQYYAAEKYSYEDWETFVVTIGPKLKRGHWAEAMVVASNYVRHFEEWDFDIFEKSGPSPKDYRLRRRNFLKSLKGKKARKNVQTLINVGVKEGELFSPINSGPLAIIEAIKSKDRAALLENCVGWMNEVHQLAAHVVRNHPENDDSPV